MVGACENLGGEVAVVDEGAFLFVEGVMFEPGGEDLRAGVVGICQSLARDEVGVAMLVIFLDFVEQARGNGLVGRANAVAKEVARFDGADNAQGSVGMEAVP